MFLHDLDNLLLLCQSKMSLYGMKWYTLLELDEMRAIFYPRPFEGIQRVINGDRFIMEVIKHNLLGENNSFSSHFYIQETGSRWVIIAHEQKRSHDICLLFSRDLSLVRTA